MHISSFTLSAPGIFSDAHVSSLCPGLNIFYGPNGCGKTSCMNFLCAMLSGQPEAEQLQLEYSGVALKGNLELSHIMPDGEKIVCKISENTATGKRQLVYEPENSMEYFKKILSGLPPEEYHRIYAFDSAGLVKFADSSIKHEFRLLYEASFGATLKPPSKAYGELLEKAREICGEAENPHTIRGILKELDIIGQNISGLEYEQASRSRTEEQLLALRKSLLGIRKNRRELENNLKNLERRIAAFHEWQEWKAICEHEKELSDAPLTFPSDAIKRLELILSASHSAEQQLAARKARIASLESQRNQLEYNQRILDQLPRLRELSERKGSLAIALAQMAGLREKRSTLEKELNSSLESLGSGWNCDRINSIDRSLFTREKLEQGAEELTVAKEANQAAYDALGTANQEVTAAETALEASRIALAALPEPDSEISTAQREELRANIGRLQECKRQNSSREKNLENARLSLTRALELAHISPVLKDGNIDHDSTRKSVMTLLQSREEGLDISEKLQKHLSERNLANERLKVLENQSENTRKKIDDLSFNARKNGASIKNSIESRRHALQELRGNISKLDRAKEKLENIEQQLTERPQPAKSFRSILFWPGILILAISCALLILSHLEILNQFQIGDITVPVNLTFCYSLVAAGVLMFSLGMPYGKNANKAYRQMNTRLLTAKEAELAHINDLNQEIQNLADRAGVDNIDPITLDATEMLLEREKVQSIHDERTSTELENLDTEHQNELGQIRETQASINDLENEIQKCRKQWQDLLDRLRIADSPTPESAPTVFARVEACQIALDNVKNAEIELDALLADLHGLEESIASMPAIAARLDEGKETVGLEEAVRLVLESCKNADKIWQEKVQAQAAIKTVENELSRSHARQEEAARRLEIANARLEKAREDWQKFITDFGTDDYTDPQTLREALRVMDKCLATESALETVKNAINSHETEISDIDGALAEILRTLDLPGINRNNGEKDILATLNQLIDMMEENTAKATECKRLESLIASHNEDLAATSAELNTLENREKALLSQTTARNREEFLKMAEKFETRQTFAKARAKLEDSLQQAAPELPLEKFLASFDENELSNHETEINKIHAELDKLSDHEQALLNESAMLSASIKGQDQSENLLVLRQQKAMLTASFQHKCLEWGKYACAAKIMKEAIASYETANQPQLAKLASAYFADMVGANWQGMRVSIEDKKVLLLNAGGRAATSDKVNRSIMELAYLALRLAYIHETANITGALPVLMDDAFTGLDTAHVARLANLLGRIAKAKEKNPGQQFLIFTCHENILEIFRENTRDARFFNFEKGIIEAA